MALTGLIYNTSKENDREQWRRSLAEAGLTLVAGSFEEGATVNSKTDAIWYIAGGQCYTWGVAETKTVPVKSTPTSMGGVGPGKWLSVGDGLLRSALASTTGNLGDGMLGVKQSFTGAVPRTQHDKNAESISVKDFGVKGDGTSDDTVAFQLAIDSAYAANKELLIPAGEYILDTLTVKSGNHFSKHGFSMRGEGVNSTVLWFKNQKDAIKIAPLVTGDSTYHVRMSDFGVMQLDSNGAKTEDGPGLGVLGDGISCSTGASHIFIDNIRTNGMNRSLYFYNTWDTSINRVTMGNCMDGIIIDGGTTIEIDNCYVYWSKGRAYKINGIYSKIGALACDHPMGVPYDFEYFGGSIGSLGVELMGTNPTTDLFKFGNSIADVGYIYALGLGTATQLDNVFNFGGSSVNIHNVEIQSGGTTAAVPARFYKSYQSKVSFGNIVSNHTFAAIDQTISNDVASSTVSFGGVKQNFGGVRPYIGSLGYEGQDVAQPGKDYTPPAFIFDCFGGFKLAGSTGGTNLGFAAGPRIGQWGIERRPDLAGVAAYVSLTNAVDNNAAVDPTKSSRVPLISYATARPTNPAVGAMWSRASDKKVYIYNYGGWFDLMGNPYV